MNKTIQSISLTVVAIIFISLTCLGNIVKADDDKRLMISGFTFEDEEIQAGQAFDFSLQVLALEAGVEENAALSKSEPASDAVVKVIFTKNNIKKDITIKNGKDGNYIGTVTLPVDGEWTISAVASKDGQDVEGADAFTSTFNVDKEASSGTSTLWKLILIIASVLVLIWTLKRLEPKLKQIQKKKPRV